MKRYNTLKESFSSELYKNLYKELIKHIPKESLNGISAYGTKIGTRKNWEVTIPKNSFFKNGLYIHVGRADDIADAKSKALDMILKRIYEPEVYGTIQDLIRTGSIQ